MEIVLSFEDARAAAVAAAMGVRAPLAETVPLHEALSRVLANPVVADRDYPPFDRATRDGYAVRSSDVAQVPTTLRCRGQIKAGGAFNSAVGSGECIEIMTGAAVPSGADAVVMVEFTAVAGDQVQFARSVTRGENIVRSGAECKRGDVGLTPGTRLRAQEISVAATAGCTKLQVYARPKVAILSTGDEVVEVERMPGPVQIRNSNAHSLAAQVKASGGEPLLFPIAPDEPRRLKELIVEGLKADLLLLSGGVSMGKHDLVEGVLEQLEAKFHFTGVKIQPGKPLVFGSVGDTLFFGLPGNPVSTMVTFELFARAIVDALSGAVPNPLRFTQAILLGEFKTKIGLTRFLPAKLLPHLQTSKVAPVAWHGSGDVFAQSKADCLLVVPPDRERIADGEAVTVLLL
jgi:molybdopterin molybdotransferase